MARVTLTVVDTLNDQTMNIARRTYPDSIPADSVWSMVDGILTRLSLTRAPDGVEIGLLRIFGHGAPGLQAIGNSYSTNNPRQFISLDRHGQLNNRNVLNRLRGWFATGAIVELHGCHVGGPGFGALQRSLQSLWGVRVRASAATQWASTPGLDYFER